MAMGKKPSSRRQRGMWVATQKLPRSPGHPFYERLNQVLEKAGFDAFVEGLCARFYAAESLDLVAHAATDRRGDAP